MKVGSHISPNRSIDRQKKQEVCESMLVEDVPVTEDERDRLFDHLTRYPLEWLQAARDNGVKMYVLSGTNEPDGTLKPTDLGFGDYDGDGVVDPEQWVDLNGNRKSEPWEYEGMIPMPNSKGELQAVSINTIEGAYAPDKKVFYLHHELITPQREEFGQYGILHEFGHALDFTLREHPEWGETWSRKVDSLYESVKSEPNRKYIGPYAASNVYEFLAVGMQSHLTESSLSDEKRKFGIEHCHRENLKTADAAFDQFLEKALKHPTEPELW